MSDEVEFDGTCYISSKRASKSSGYTQDYIGQLARGGKIDARRVGGLWYVKEGELEAYKEAAERFVPKPPEYSRPNDSALESIVSFDGREYVSAVRAARQTGYHQDYIGQLARGGRVMSRQIGSRWYVDLEALKAHKNEKDSLLAAVQVESVGLHRVADAIPATSLSHLDMPEDVHYRYLRESGDLLPIPTVSSSYDQILRSEESEVFQVPIRVTHETALAQPVGHKVPVSGHVIVQGGGSIPILPLVTGIFAAVVLVVSVGAWSLSEPRIEAYTNIRSLRETASSFVAFETVFSPLRTFFTKTLVYQRQ